MIKTAIKMNSIKLAKIMPYFTICHGSKKHDNYLEASKHKLCSDFAPFVMTKKIVIVKKSLKSLYIKGFGLCQNFMTNLIYINIYIASYKLAIYIKKTVQKNYLKKVTTTNQAASTKAASLLSKLATAIAVKFLLLMQNHRLQPDTIMVQITSFSLQVTVCFFKLINNIQLKDSRVGGKYE